MSVWPASGSVAVAVNVKSDSSFTVRSPMVVSTGHVFAPTSVTEIVMSSKSVQAGSPLSVTRTVTGYVPGPCSAEGVKLNTPVPADPGLPPGTRIERERERLAHIRVGCRRREREERQLSHGMVSYQRSTGQRFPPATSLTVIEMISKSLHAGSALSVTRIVSWCKPGP